jgi:hypothetical protein
MMVRLFFLLLVFGLSFLNIVAQAADAGKPTVIPASDVAKPVNRSAIQRLNVQRSLTQVSQMYLPRGFQRDQDNLVTLRGNGQAQQIVVLYRYLPLPEGQDATASQPQQIVVNLTAEDRVKQVAIPLPESEIFKADAKKSRFKKEETASKETRSKQAFGKEDKTPPPPSDVAPSSYRYNSIQIQAVVMDAQGSVAQRLPLLDAGGQLASHDVLPLLEPHDGSQAVVMPALPGMDPAALRGIQSMAELAGDEEKRKRLQYDGTINRDRSLDKNTFIDGGAGTGSRIPGL